MATKPTLESLSSLHLMLRSPPRVENNGVYENMAYFIFCLFVITCNMFMLHHILSYLRRIVATGVSLVFFYHEDV